jgi:hypothetical protein
VCDPISLGIATLAVTAGGTVAQMSASKKALNAQKAAAAQSETAATQAAAEAERANNAANQKKPNVAGIIAEASRRARGGVGSTMLTGPQGVAGSTLSLGRTSLLGG